MDTGVRRPASDSFSQILSIISILIAGVTAFYVYMQGQTLESRDALSKTFQQELDKQAADFDQQRDDLAAKYQASIDEHNKRLGEWNDGLNDAIATFRADGTKLLEEIAADDKLAQSMRETTFDQLVSDLRTNASVEMKSTSDGASDAADTVPEINPPAGDDALANVFPQPQLRVSETVFRAGTGNTTVFTITNTGSEPAAIRGLRFRPKSDFESVDTPELSSSVVQGAVTSINFAPTDNKSTRTGYHGTYQRDLQQAISVPAGESRAFRVTIVDPEHTGWGLVGRLELDYGTDKPVVVDAAHVTFVKSS